MPTFRKDQYGLYKLFDGEKFQSRSEPGKWLCRYFDERGKDGIADLDACLKRTEPASEREYVGARQKHLL